MTASRATGASAGQVDDAVLLARAYLSRVSEPANVALWDLVRTRGPVAAVADIRAGRVEPDVRVATAGRRGNVDPEADLDAAARRGIRLVVPESPDWPHFALGALERLGADRVAAVRSGHRGRDQSGEPVPPLALWVRGTGELAAIGVRSVGIVGARAATGYGNHVSAEFAFELAVAGMTVVSGGAYGIDAAAHRAALAAGGTTLAVSAGGLDRPYPAGNEGLFEQIAATGLLVSESPPGCAPQRSRFLTRNRLIAAFSTGVVIVEAASRSGATNTATHAFRQGRPVMAVPGSVQSTMSVGCHDLLRRARDPALLVTSAAEVLGVVGPMGSGVDPSERAVAAPVDDVRAELDRLDPVARRVFDGLTARRYCRPDEIAARSGTSALEVIRALPVLDLAGLLESANDGYRIAARLRPAGSAAR